MNEADASSPQAQREAQRARLVLACELDRLNLRLALRPKPAATTIAGVPMTAVNQAFSIAQLIPGRIGRWARRAAAAAEVLGALNFFRR